MEEERQKLTALKVPELKKLLADRGLEVPKLKKDMIEMLLAHHHHSEEKEEEPTAKPIVEPKAEETKQPPSTPPQEGSKKEEEPEIMKVEEKKEEKHKKDEEKKDEKMEEESTAKPLEEGKKEKRVEEKKHEIVATIEETPKKRRRGWAEESTAATQQSTLVTSDTLREIITTNPAKKEEKPATKAEEKKSQPQQQQQQQQQEITTANEQINQTNSPSNTLFVSKFVRPFTIQQVKTLLGQFGEIKLFWMNSIKSHCYVSYSDIGSATKAKTGLEGLNWPPNNMNPNIKLHADFSTEEIAKRIIERETATQPPKKLSESLIPQNDSTNTTFRVVLETNREQKQVEEEKGKSLEELFRKTKAKPHVYWIPLTEDQIAARSRRFVPSIPNK